jgi:acyl-coenzyme A synthetase/AMP-(fatty) acid ligase
VVVVGQLEKDRYPRGHVFDEFSNTVGVEVIPYPRFLDKSATEISFHRGSAADPLWVLFSSGTSEYDVETLVI